MITIWSSTGNSQLWKGLQPYLKALDEHTLLLIRTEFFYLSNEAILPIIRV